MGRGTSGLGKLQTQDLAQFKHVPQNNGLQLDTPRAARV